MHLLLFYLDVPKFCVFCTPKQCTCVHYLSCKMIQVPSPPIRHSLDKKSPPPKKKNKKKKKNKSTRILSKVGPIVSKFVVDCIMYQVIFSVAVLQKEWGISPPPHKFLSPISPSSRDKCVIITQNFRILA